MQWMWFIWISGAYVVGSLSFALLLGKLRGVDVRRHGSGNIGATNVGRVLGRKWGILCFVLDVLKGFVPVLAAGLMMGMAGGREPASQADAWAWLAVGAAAVCGHVFPFYLGFRGGKGVATSFGVLLGFWPVLTLPALGALLVWAAAVGVWRYVGLASVLAAVSLPVLLLAVNLPQGRGWGQLMPFAVVSAALAGLVTWRHRGNLKRIAAGQEPKIGRKRRSDEATERRSEEGRHGGTEARRHEAEGE